MNADFHYYATYCAALLAGYTNEESERIAYAANFVDCCTATLLKKCGAPVSAATTQSQLELADYDNSPLALREITRIWSSFHFLPGDLYAEVKRGFINYKMKYRLICQPNGELLQDTIKLARGGSLEAKGIAMHILADTWAHHNFAGTPSLVINNVDIHVYEVFEGKDYQINFSHNPAKPDSIDRRRYVNSLYNSSENSIMNLGHGRMGHLPDLSFIKYKYMPSYAKYSEVIKDNPIDYMNAFSQMVYALKCLKNDKSEFKLNEYDSLKGYKTRIKEIIEKRQLSTEQDYRKLANELSGKKVKPFDITKYPIEYIKSNDKNSTLFGEFILHAMKQKSMVTNRIYKSKNVLAGYSVEYTGKKIKGLKDYRKIFSLELEKIKEKTKRSKK